MNNKNANCCNKENIKAPSCRSKASCTPCLIIWGIVLLVVIAQYFIR